MLAGLSPGVPSHFAVYGIASDPPTQFPYLEKHITSLQCLPLVINNIASFKPSVQDIKFFDRRGGSLYVCMPLTFMQRSNEASWRWSELRSTQQLFNACSALLRAQSSLNTRRYAFIAAASSTVATGSSTSYLRVKTSQPECNRNFTTITAECPSFPLLIYHTSNRTNFGAQIAQTMP